VVSQLDCSSSKGGKHTNASSPMMLSLRRSAATAIAQTIHMAHTRRSHARSGCCTSTPAVGSCSNQQQRKSARKTKGSFQAAAMSNS
jgi:hypothetical protein